MDKRVCHAFASVHYSFVVTCWERVDLLALLYVMLYCAFVTFPCGVLGQVSPGVVFGCRNSWILSSFLL